MRVFEAAGSGLQNQGLLNNIVGYAKYTVATNAVTITNAVGGLGSSGATSDLPLCTVTFSPRYGTTVPNIFIQCGNSAAASGAMALISGAASNSFAFRPMVVISALTATDQNFMRAITGAETAFGTIFMFGYSATGTVTT